MLYIVEKLFVKFNVETVHLPLFLQSSCTRSDMEAESAHMQNIVELKQQNSRDISFVEHTLAQIGETHTQLDSSLLMREGEAKGTISIPVNIFSIQLLLCFTQVK